MTSERRDLLRDRLGDFGKGVFDSADLDAPKPGTVEALLTTLGIGAATTATTATTAATKATTTTAAASTASKVSAIGLTKLVVVATLTVGGAIALGRTLDRPATPASAPVARTVQAPERPPPPTIDLQPPSRAAEPPTARAATPDPTATKSASGHARPTSPAPTTPAKGLALADQVVLMDLARASLRDGETTAALGATRRFEQQFGRSAVLYPEAMLVALQAHLARGDDDDAQRVEAGLRATHPASPAARRATELLQAAGGR